MGNKFVRSISVKKSYSSIHKIMAKVIDKGTSSQTCENHKTIHQCKIYGLENVKMAQFFFIPI
jgi:hypothetical protein